MSTAAASLALLIGAAMAVHALDGLLDYARSDVLMHTAQYFGNTLRR